MRSSPVGPRVVVEFSPLSESEAEALVRARRRAGAPADAEVRVLKRSLDARKRQRIGFRLEIGIYSRAGTPTAVAERLAPPPLVGRPAHVVVVGTGPAGTFAALRLTQAGVAVTLLDRGKPVQPRRRDLAELTRGRLDPESNYCFGEGGAGTFSDGKLYTRSKDRLAVRSVLATLVDHGAPADILVDSRPHIGSNRLPKVLIAMRTALLAGGVRYRWSEAVTELVVHEGRVVGVRTARGDELGSDAVVLATGHSARDVYELCAQQGVALSPKAFAIGARVEHPQPFVDRLQYGEAAGHPRLPAAFYECAVQVKTSTTGERGVYSFCMCPGGWIVDASTEAGHLCVNGMSLSRRDSPLANSALVVTVTPADYADLEPGPLGGIAFQRRIEAAAFAAGGGDYAAAQQSLPDFLANRPSQTTQRSTYRPRTVPGSVRATLPLFVGDALAAALPRLGRQLPGFVSAQAHFVGVETRTSAPVRIERGADLQSTSHAGLYPAAEGAGYAGGIVSAAIDGLRIADAILAAL